MSEFKFTCPVCGQHIAVDATTAGAQIECPTCFQRILVPRAPQAGSKFILSATQYIKPQVVPAPPPTPVATRKKFTPAILASMVFVGLLAVALYLLTQNNGSSDAVQPPVTPPAPVRGDQAWNLNLVDAGFPGAAAAGKIHARNFLCQRAVLQGSTLALAQNSGADELIVNVYFPMNAGPESNSRSFDIRTNHMGARPRITLRWREGNLRGSQTFSNGYAMKLELAQSEADKASGKIYLCLPDDAQSFVAGTFDADIRKSIPARQH